MANNGSIRDMLSLRLQRITQNLRHMMGKKYRTLAFLFFLMNIFLISPLFTPSLLDLGPFDEMIHINSGRELIEGNLPNVAGHPLLSLVYAIAYLPFMKSPFWIVYAAGMGRLMLFSLMWWGAYLVAEQFLEDAPPLIMAGTLLVTPLLTELFLNPSDALFAALSAFSLWQFLHYAKTKDNVHLIATSILLGLAALSRGDGLILFILFVVLSVAFSLSSLKSARMWARFLVRAFLPFVVIVYGYVLVYGLSTGNFELGLKRYSYITFEHGHEALYHSSIGNATLEAAREATRIFGTPAENDFFFINAIRRNPEPYFERLKIIITGIPSALVNAYGKRYMALLFLFALRGAWALFRKKSYLALSILAIWPVHLGSYFLVGFVRLNYLRMPFFIVYVLASIGLYTIVAANENRREKITISALLLLLAVYSVVDNKFAIFVGVSIFLLGFWMIWYGMNRFADAGNRLTAALLVCLSLGLIIRAEYPSPGIRKLGVDTLEQSLVFMTDNLEPGSRVMSTESGYALAARMEYVGYSPSLRDLESSDVFYQWLLDNDVQALRTTSWLAKREPKLWAMIEEQIGKGLVEGFRQDPGDVRILFVKLPQEP